MKRQLIFSARSHLVFAALAATVALLVQVRAEPQKLSPGSELFTPSRIDWLTTTLQASLRTDGLYTEGYLLEITSSDPQTIVIYVRYLPNVNREAMNMGIDAARKVIGITAKSYGWDGWLRVREVVQPGKPPQVEK